MRRIRAAIPVQERQAKSERVAGNLFGIPAMREALTVLLFYSFGSEIPTSAMVDRLLGSGRRVLLPYLDEGGMEAAQLGEDRLLAATTYGPREPSERVAVDPAEIDVVVTPGLAFDSEGHRLGYGGGHYDRYLRRLPPTTETIGIGFEVQMVDRIPAEPGDEPVGLVVTEERVIDCREARNRR
jgi:5-formyltetrahydrofolate cyclo-ligase